MNKPSRALVIWALLLSPVWIGVLISLAKPHWQGDFAMMLRQALGVAAIGVVGLATSIFTRKASNADTLSVVGYAAAAILVCGYQLFVALRA